jgi:hypothetical protein
MCVPTDCDGPRAGIDQPERGSGPTNFRSKTGYAADVHHNNINDGCLAARFAGHAPFAEQGANANRATRHSADDA